MATTYTITNSFTAGTTAVASQVNQNFTDILTAINGLDAANLTSNSVPLARISGLTTTQFAANVVDTDDTLAADSDTRLPSQSAVKDYVTNTIQAAVGATTISPTSYAAEESVTFTNGRIEKQGNATYLGSDLTVTFAVAFPTACTRVIVSLNDSAWNIHYAPVLISKAAANFVVSSGNATSLSIDWFAIGY
jgi:hypothetical protein